MKEENQSYAIVHFLKDKKGMSKDEIAEAAGVSRRMVDYTLSGHQKQLGSKAISRIAESMGIHLSQLLQAAMSTASDLPGYDELCFVRKMNARPRGGDGGNEVLDGYDTNFSFQRRWIETKGNPASMRLFDVVGDSMAPTINEGDMILVDQSRTDEWIPGHIYLITLNDAFMIKRAAMEPGFIVLRSDNKDKASHPDIRVPVESLDYFQNHGRIIWSCREF